METHFSTNTHTHTSLKKGKVLKLSRPRKLIYIYSKPQSSSVFAYLYLCCDLHSNDDNSSTSSCKGKQPTASATFAVSFSILHFNYLILLQSACITHLSLSHTILPKNLTIANHPLHVRSTLAKRGAPQQQNFKLRLICFVTANSHLNSISFCMIVPHVGGAMGLGVFMVFCR